MSKVYDETNRWDFLKFHSRLHIDVVNQIANYGFPLSTEEEDSI